MFSENKAPGRNVFYIVVICCTFFQLQQASSARYPNCTIKWRKRLPSWYPLIFNGSGIVYPQRTGNNNSDWSIVFPHNTDFNISCSSKSNTLDGYKTSEIKVHCNKNTITSRTNAKNNPFNFQKLGCKKPVKENVVAVGKCYNKSTSIDILFQSKSKRFPLINICHNTEMDETIFTHHFIIGPGLNPFEVSNKRPSFKEGKFYTTFNANDAYKQASQLNQVASLVGSQTLAKKYIDKKHSFYFARGHLAPDGDFVHIYEQNATYYFVNVVPQWQSINNGNWKALESALRTYAKDKNINLEIWTGGKDVMKLDDVNGNPVEIYMAKDSTGKLTLPAPEVTWKVVKDPARNASVAVFMINNPHFTQDPATLILCPCVCSQISWVTWDIKKIAKGYTHCCEMSSIKKILPFIEDLDSLPLLT